MHVLVVVFSSLHYITDKTDKTDKLRILYNKSMAGFSYTVLGIAAAD